MPAWLFASLRGYRLSFLPRDLVAGIMLAAIAIPGQLATARLAGMPPETGLYAFAAGSLAFAAFGANRFISVGADSTIAPIFAGGLAAMSAAGSADYAGLATWSTVPGAIPPQLAGAIYPSSPANPSVTWGRVKRSSAGTILELFKKQLSLGIEHYRQTASDLPILFLTSIT